MVHSRNPPDFWNWAYQLTVNKKISSDWVAFRGRTCHTGRQPAGLRACLAIPSHSGRSAIHKAALTICPIFLKRITVRSKVVVYYVPLLRACSRRLLIRTKVITHWEEQKTIQFLDTVSTSVHVHLRSDLCRQSTSLPTSVFINFRREQTNKILS